MNIPSLKDINENIKQYTSPKFLKKNFPDFYQYLLNTYPWITKISEGMYLYFNRLQRPICRVCGNYVPFYNWSSGYREYCSRGCTSRGTRNKARSTMVNKFGAPTSFERSNFQEISKQTMQERYGGIGLQSPQISQKIKQTMRERYGVNRSGQSEQIKQKIKQTMQERYGGIGLQSPQISQKIKQTMRERYGVENPSLNDDIKNNIISKHINKYGGIGFASPLINQKIRSTLISKYRVDNQAKSGLLHGKNTIYISESLLGYTEDGKWICKCPHPECTKCQEKQYIIKRQVQYDRSRVGAETCTRLNPQNSFTSSLELFIQKILDNNHIEYQVQNRSLIGQELDIYIPSYNIAIECNGVYWHSTKHNQDHKRHLNKYIACQLKNVQLITIWEDWIINNPEIVESLILSKLKQYKKRIGARQCTLQYVKSCAKFLDANHIQGSSKSSIHMILKYKDETVAAMEFSKRSKLSGGQKEDCWELTRFCTKLHWQVIGAASRLLNRFIKDYRPSKIISFSSNDISKGDIYNCLGFTSEHTPTTAYWYITPSMKRYHRTNFMKKKLIEMGEDPNKTEFEIMDSKPIFRIYDSGHVKHTLVL